MCKLCRKWERAPEELDMPSSLRIEGSLTGQRMDDIRKRVCSGHTWTRRDPLLFFLSHCFRVRQMWYTFFALLIFFFTLGNFLAFLFSGLVKPCLLPVSEVNEVMFPPGPAFGRMQPCFTDQHVLKNETWAWKHTKAFPGWSQETVDDWWALSSLLQLQFRVSVHAISFILSFGIVFKQYWK